MLYTYFFSSLLSVFGSFSQFCFNVKCLFVKSGRLFTNYVSRKSFEIFRVSL